MANSRQQGPERAPLYATLVAGAVSEIGNVFSALAIPWFVLQTTGSPAKTGLVAASTVVAFVLAGFFGGPIVDRLGLKTNSISSDIASGLSVSLVPILHGTVGIAFWQLTALAFLGALLDAPGRAARQSLLPELAARAETPIERANSAYIGVGRGAQLLGAPLAGILIVAFGAANVLFLNAASFIFSAALLAAAIPSSARATRSEAEGLGYFAELAEGLKFIHRNPLIFLVVMTATATEFLDAPLEPVALPVYANTVMGSPTSLGVMLAGLGGGALLGSVVYGAIGHRLPRRATFTVCLLVLQILFWTLATTPPLWIAVSALAIAGIAAGPLNAMLYTIIQERTPKEMLGRVFSAFSASSMAAVPLGMILCGVMLELIGLRYTLFGIAVLYLLVTLTLIFNPALREMDERKSKTSKETIPLTKSAKR